MATHNYVVHSKNDEDRKMSTDYLTNNIQANGLEIVLDDQSFSNSSNEDSNSQERTFQVGTSDTEEILSRRKKSFPVRMRENRTSKRNLDGPLGTAKKDPKSHRMIEKRRRDRMNACLRELLELTPHENTDSQRRIEKTEIIEMAIRHIRHLINLTEKKEKKTDQNNVDVYRTGFHNALADTLEYVERHFHHDQLLLDLIEHFKTKENDLKNLTVVPCRNRLSYNIRSDKKKVNDQLRN